MSFEGKVILLTAASTGIGATTAEYFAKEGAILALVGRNAEKFEALLEKIKESGVETEPLVIIADVTVDAERIVGETIEKYGRLDVLVNNAGCIILGSIETLKLEQFDTVMATNLGAAVELTQLSVPYLIESKGNVVNVSSISGILSGEFTQSYSISKAALDQFTKCAAMELAAKGVRVNSVNPGVVETPIHFTFGIGNKDDDTYAAHFETMAQKHPLKRNGTTEECAHAIAFLASEKASFITGVLLPVDGGITKKSIF